MKVLILGVGAFAHSMMQIFQECGAETGCYLTRSYGHYGASLVGKTWSFKDHQTPMPIIEEFQPDLMILMSIAWYQESWAKELVTCGVPLFCPTGEALRIESERHFASELCQKFGVAVPKFYTAKNRLEALEFVKEYPCPYVLKNPLCSPYSPIHTILCETTEDTLGWLDRIDYAEGVFLQEYLGRAEAGHFAFISNGEIYSIATNQEYKHAFDGEMGPIAGAPLGGIVEQDHDDRYGLAKDLIHPLKDWLRESHFCGPLQVAAIRRHGRWHAIEYNVRLGVTSGALFLRMMENPLDAIHAVVNQQTPSFVWNEKRRFGCSITLAGYGYPFVVPSLPQLPVKLKGIPQGELWWNEVDSDSSKQLFTVGQTSPVMGLRLADCCAFGKTIQDALKIAYHDIALIQSLGSYYRTDIGTYHFPEKFLEVSH